MSFTDIKIKNQGFTIVELLIVVVVIAILAAITIVSYNGITTKANQSAAKETASNVLKKTELYNGEVGHYPSSSSQLLSAPSDKSYKLTGVGLFSATETIDADNGKDTVKFVPCAGASTTGVTDSNVTGVKITYWAYSGTTTTDLIAGKCS